jgi:hypothetical protein
VVHKRHAAVCTRTSNVLNVAADVNDDKSTEQSPVDYSWNTVAVTQAVWHSLHGYESNGAMPLFGKCTCLYTIRTCVQHNLVTVVTCAPTHGWK